MMEELEVTVEELRELLNKQTAQIEELTTERDSFKEENQNLQEEMTQLKTDLQDTKKLNYTLARHLDTQKKNKSFDDALITMFGKKKGL